MQISRAQAATLLVCAINANPHRDDLIDNRLGDEHPFGCCPRCCATCAVIRELIDDDTIDDVLLYAPADLGVTRYAWWDAENERFNRSWAHTWWDLYPCPNHESAPTTPNV